VNGRGLSIPALGDQGTAGLAMGGMSLVSTLTMAVAGRLGDRRRSHARIAAAGVAFTVPGLLMVGAAHSLALLAAGTAVVGVGMGALGPSVPALLVGMVEPELRGRGTGALQLCGDVGGMLGPVVGTTLTGVGASAPYLVAAATLVAVFPVAMWLARLERLGPGAPARAPEIAPIDAGVE